MGMLNHHLFAKRNKISPPYTQTVQGGFLLWRRPIYNSSNSLEKIRTVRSTPPPKNKNLPLLIGVAGDFKRCVRDSNP